MRSALDQITKLGGLLGIKTATVVERATFVAWTGELRATIPHRFNALSISGQVSRDSAQAACGPWLDALAGDQLDLELGSTTTIAHSADAALPADAPAAVRALGDDLASVGWDGEAWTYAVTQLNAGSAADATIARFDAIAVELGVTEAQRRIAAGLHTSLNRGMPTRTWLRARGGELDPIVGLSWDLVEWLPIQHMMSGFYPALDAETKIGRLQRNSGIEHATIDLVLGPADPPGMRIHLTIP